MRTITLALAAGLLLTGAGRGADDTEAFFNGKDLTGWEGLDKFWRVEDGAIVGGSTEPIPFNTFLCSKKKYGDFELSFQVRLKGGGANSGVQIRSAIFDRERLAVMGPQCDMGGGYWGSLYGEHFDGTPAEPGKVPKGKMMQAAPKEVVSMVLKPDDFNDYSIRCVGKRVTIKLNGETTVDAEFPILPPEGIIAWQVHAGGPMEVTFRNIRFKEVK
jgi:hypothetical protein